jgi:hypothetical protein
MRSWILIAAIAVACLAWTQGPDVPRLGWLLDDSGGLRPLTGLAGNFVPGDALLDGVLSAGSSGDWTLAKTAHDLIVLDRVGVETSRIETPGGEALFAFAPNGEPAAAYFPGTGLVLLWTGDRFEAAGWTIGQDEGVLSVACPESRTVAYLARRGDAIWQVDRAASSGQITREQLLPGVGAPALLGTNGSVLYADGKALVLRMPETGELRLDLPGSPAALGQVAGGWTSVRLADRQLAVAFFGGRPRAYELPAGAR